MTQPDAHELLDIARSTLLEQLLPALPGELRYPALMIANAMAIAARESRLVALAEDQERTRLAALVDEAPAALPDLRRQLARAIRLGSHDAPQNHRTLVETLRQVTSPDWPSAIPRPCPERRQPSHSRQTSTQKDNHELHPPGRTARLAGQDPRLHRRTGHPARERPRQDSHGPSDALRQDLVARARAAGLLTPHASREMGGLALSHVAKAIVFEEAGYSPLGPVALNIHAPDEGNIHLMDVVATEAQKDRWLRPLVRAMPVPASP